MPIAPLIFIFLRVKRQIKLIIVVNIAIRSFIILVIFPWSLSQYCLIFSTFYSQHVPPTPGQPVKEPMFIPIEIGLLDSSGKDMPLSSIYHDGTLHSLTNTGGPVNSTVLRVTKV